MHYEMYKKWLCQLRPKLVLDKRPDFKPKCESMSTLAVWAAYRENQLLASEDPDSRDAAVIVGTKQDDTGKGVLPESVQTLEHAWKGRDWLKHGLTTHICFTANI